MKEIAAIAFSVIVSSLVALHGLGGVDFALPLAAYFFMMFLYFLFKDEDS